MAEAHSRDNFPPIIRALKALENVAGVKGYDRALVFRLDAQGIAEFDAVLNAWGARRDTPEALRTYCGTPVHEGGTMYASIEHAGEVIHRIEIMDMNAGWYAGSTGA